MTTAAQLDIAQELINRYGQKEVMESLARMSGYDVVPPTIMEFMTDPYYLGESLVDDEGKLSIYPIWQDALKKIYPNQFYSPYKEVIFTGSIGQGKTTIAKIGCVYDACKLLCLKEPHSYLGVGKAKKMVFAFVNATLDLGKNVLLDEIENWFSASPFFREMMATAPRNCQFPKNIDITAGSRGTHVLGADVVSALLSELNFQDKVANQAYDNYTNAKRRIQSRFLGAYKRTGSYPGRLWLDSSKKDSASFLDSHIENAYKDPMTIVFDYPIWEVHKHKGIYSGKTFQVYVGSKARDPFIVTHKGQVGNDTGNVIDVPIEYEIDFQQDPFNALRDLAGKGTWSSHTFITSHTKIAQALSIVNPVSIDVVQLDFQNEDRIIDSLLLDQIKPDARPRFIHIDIGLKHDKTGIACTRLDGFAEVKRFNSLTGKYDTTRDPLFKTEWVLAIEPTPGNEVPIYKIKNFMIDLKNNGVPIALVSTDGYQSTNLRQDLILVQFNAELISVDRTKDPYETMKNSLLEGRWTCANHPILEKELQELVDMGKKIDHPKNGSKDLADSCAGSIYAAYHGIAKHGANFNVGDFLEVMDQFEEPSTIYDKIAGGAMRNSMWEG